MHKKNIDKSRTGFLKKLPIIITAVGLGLVTVNFKKLHVFFSNKFRILSDSEANEHIKKIASSDQRSIKPEPPPKFHQPSDGLEIN